MLGPLRRREVVLLAAASAIGEELLFRGAMQPALGLWPTAAIFAALHFPPRPRLWPWTASTGAIGVALGLLARATGDLAGATLAHFTVNALNLAAVIRRAGGADGDGAGDGRDAGLGPTMIACAAPLSCCASAVAQRRARAGRRRSCSGSRPRSGCRSPTSCG
jgi:hypothetical protein